MHPGGGGGAIRVLSVAEKPSVAKSVAKILLRGRLREGRYRYNRVFEFDYAIGGRACHMLVTSVTGHLMELYFDDRFRPQGRTPGITGKSYSRTLVLKTADQPHLERQCSG